MNPPFRQPGNLFFSKNSLHKLLVNSLKIKLAEENDQERWDEYVNRHPDSSPYHLFAWQKAVKQAYGFRSYSLLAQDGVNVTGILPLISPTGGAAPAGAGTAAYPLSLLAFLREGIQLMQSHNYFTSTRCRTLAIMPRTASLSG